MLNMTQYKDGPMNRERSAASPFRSLAGVLITLGSVIFANFASAADKIITLEPGDARIAEDITKPRTMRWAMTHIVPGKPTKQRGVWLDKHEIVEVNGRKLRRHQSDAVWAKGRPKRDIVYWDNETMETVSAELENYNNKGGWSYFVYGENSFAQVVRQEPYADTLSQMRDFENRVFEQGHGFVFAILLDLQLGGKIRYPYHERRSDEVKWLTIEAVSPESIETQNYGNVDALLLKTDLGWRYWTTRDPPYLYRLEIPSADGGFNRWELLEYIVGE